MNAWSIKENAKKEIARLRGLAITEHDLYYLRSILGHLREIRKIATDASLGGEVLADNIDWLDCFIDKHQRALHEPNSTSESSDA